MVVVIIPHASFPAQLSNVVEHFTAALQIVQISIGIKFDVAANLCVSQLCVIVQYSRQKLLPQRVHMAAHDLQAEFLQGLPHFPCRQAETHPWVRAGIVVCSLYIPVASLRQLFQYGAGVPGDGVLHRIQLNSNF